MVPVVYGYVYGFPLWFNVKHIFLGSCAIPKTIGQTPSTEENHTMSEHA